MAMDLRHGLFGKCPADGVEQKIGFLGQEPRVWSDSSWGISFRVFAGKLEITERISAFSALDGAGAGGTFLLLGFGTLLLPKSPEAKSSEKLNDTLEFFSFVTVRLRRVTKRPTDRGQSLERKKIYF